MRRGQITGVLATREDPEEGRHGQTFVARGIRFDIQAQHWVAEGVQDRGPSAALERIWETLDVPANSFLPAMQSQKKMDRLLAAAGRDAKKRPESALRYLGEVRTLAQSMYLYSLMVGHFPEIPAIQYVVIALAQGFQLTESMLPLRDAEQLAWRAHTELSSLPVAAEEVADLRGKLEDMVRSASSGCIRPFPAKRTSRDGLIRVGGRQVGASSRSASRWNGTSAPVRRARSSLSSARPRSVTS